MTDNNITQQSGIVNTDIVCKHCHKAFSVPSAAFCPFCGYSVRQSEKRPKSRGNGQGTAYKRNKTWTLVITTGFDADGHQKRKTKGGFKTKSDALNYAETFRNLPKLQSCSKLFSALFVEWLNNYSKRIGQTTISNYKSAYKHFRPIYNLRFTDIRVSDLQSCIDHCTAGKRTKENMKSLANLMYRYAIQQEIITQNKAETLYTGNDETTTREPFSRDEVELLRTSNEPYAPYVYAMCYTGFRPGEFLSLKKSSYDQEHNCLVGGSKTKAGKDRNVPISPKIKEIFLHQMELDSEYLFPNLSDGKKMTDAHFRYSCFNPLMKKLGITGKVPYSCRHTFANLLKGVSGSNTDKAAIMGHSDTSMTEYYQDADYDALKAIIDAIK